MASGGARGGLGWNWEKILIGRGGQALALGEAPHPWRDLRPCGCGTRGRGQWRPGHCWGTVALGVLGELLQPQQFLDSVEEKLVLR